MCIYIYGEREICVFISFFQNGRSPWCKFPPKWQKQKDISKFMLAFGVTPWLVQHGTEGELTTIRTCAQFATEMFLNDLPTALHMVTPQTVFLGDLDLKRPSARSGA